MSGSLAWLDRLYGVAWPTVIVSLGFVLILLVVYGPVCLFSVEVLWSLACGVACLVLGLIVYWTITLASCHLGYLILPLLILLL